MLSCCSKRGALLGVSFLVEEALFLRVQPSRRKRHRKRCCGLRARPSPAARRSPSVAEWQSGGDGRTGQTPPCLQWLEPCHGAGEFWGEHGPARLAELTSDPTVGRLTPKLAMNAHLALATIQGSHNTLPKVLTVSCSHLLKCNIPLKMGYISVAEAVSGMEAAMGSSG